jgi:putative endonuclease
MPFYTYILKSGKDKGYYFGHCNNLEVRLHNHNKGKVRSTKSRVPFIIYYFETFATKSEAYMREQFFKSLDGRNWLKQSKII